jgi:DedD protein
MNQELKHRLIGAAVVTALAAIFIPMLFDDPIDDIGKKVSELTIPEPPAKQAGEAIVHAPNSADQVASLPNAENDEALDQANSAQSLEAENADDANLKEAQEEAAPDDVLNDVVAEEYPEEEMAPVAKKSENALPKQGTDTIPPLDTGLVAEPDQAQTAQSEGDILGQPKTSAVKTRVDNNIGKKPEPSGALNAPAKANASPAYKPKPDLTGTDQASKPLNKGKEPAKKPLQLTGRWYLQAGSFGRKDNALSLFESLRKQGLPVLLETAQSDKGALYRLKIGPELSRKRAVDLKARLEKQKIKALLIAE